MCHVYSAEMSTVVHTQLTPWSFTKKPKGLGLYSASHWMVIQSHTNHSVATQDTPHIKVLTVVGCIPPEYVPLYAEKKLQKHLLVI